ncbi:MAG: 4Fe-4S dicluster domain-containing protein [Pseudomonadota bacterium]|jgi:electron transport complex protein RnfC
MIKRSFVGMATPRIEYQPLELSAPEPREIPSPKTVTLLLESPYDPSGIQDTVFVGVGETVKTGQKLSLSGDSDTYVISTVTGTVSAVSAFWGEFGRSYTAISIDVSEEAVDDQFEKVSGEPRLETAKNFLACLPGNPSFASFLDPEKPIDTIVVCGVDRDLLLSTNQHVLASSTAALKNGVRILKQITGVEHVVIAVPQHLMQEGAATGAEARAVDSEYPAALPHAIMHKTLGRTVPAGKGFEDVGVCFFSAEAVAAIGNAFDSGRIPNTKTLTLVDKDGGQSLVSAVIGTPIRDIFTVFDISINERDRIIVGGPMTGSSIYSVDYPVQPDTDGIMVQANEDLPHVSDYPCINCGECVRICPAKMPVNMLVRYLEAGLYEGAADQYDLYSCIECGLCSFVCVSRMPIFQYIKVAKHELGRMS